MKLRLALVSLLLGVASGIDDTLVKDVPVEEVPVKEVPVKETSTATTTETPMQRVIGLLAELKAKVESDGKAEQVTYDKFACWCEDTLSRKAAEISAGKKSVEDLTNLIIKTKAGLAAHTTEIQNLKKQIAANIESQREANEMRAKEAAGYAEERGESESCIGALEAAIKVLSGAGTSKTKFLETLQEAQLLGVASGIKSVLRMHAVTRRLSEDQIEAVEKFAEKPEDFVGGRTMGVSAMQVANNPFGDYAPQSTQIQGILKGMYDSFTADLEKDNADEAEKQKAHEALMATKRAELATLEATLEKSELDAAAATKLLADSKENLDNTKETLAADEAFFAETKESCQTKAAQWAERTRLRTEELNGMAQAIAILSSDEAKGTFVNATTTFLQISSKDSSDRAKALARLKELATTFKSLRIAKIALALKTSGHFDKVIAMIDRMMVLLRKEEQEDIAHRDRCENSQNANKNSQEDLENSVEKTKESITRMNNTKNEQQTDLTALEKEIEETKKAMEELLAMRNKEQADYRQALKDDTEAVALLTQAIAALSKFYVDNKIGAALVQKHKEEPISEAPETWEGSYGGARSTTGGIVAILEMLKEDLEKEISTSKVDDTEAQRDYVKDTQALQETLDAQRKKEVDMKTAIADLGVKMEAASESQANTENDLAAEGDVESALATDCAWVKETFDTRRQKRKLEMDGLVEAKNFLAGVEAGDAELPPLTF
jgi:hypothetical protein